MILSVVGTIVIVGFPVITAVFCRFAQQPSGDGKRGTIPALPGFRMVHRLVQLATIVIAPASLFFHHAALGVLYDSAALRVAGVIVCLAAIALFIFAKVRLGAEYSPCFDSRIANRVIDTGPYAYVRHPIYVANLAWLLGAFIASGSAWIIGGFAVVAAYYWTSAKAEERVLSQEFPAYKVYMQRTGSFLPPLARRPSAP